MAIASAPPWLPHADFPDLYSHALGISVLSSSVGSLRWTRRRFRRPLQSSWTPPDSLAADPYCGWAAVPAEPSVKSSNGVWKRMLVAGIGAAAVLTAGLCYSISGKGFKYFVDAPFLHAFHGKVPRLFVRSSSSGDTNLLSQSNVTIEEDAENDERKEVFSKGACIYVAATVDPIQEEAYSALTKLEIIENDANSSAFCTKREFARWLVRLNSKLERKRSQKIALSVLASGSVATAFSDVTTANPDFWCIQALGEAGIVASKLSPSNSEILVSGLNTGNGEYNFLPDSYLTRFELLDWKAPFEFPYACETDVQVSVEKTGLLDLNNCRFMSSALYMDLMAGECSTLRKVFGNTRRLQPGKPVTILQAAVALVCGRMKDAIHDELNRLEAENQAKLMQMSEIRAELINRGEIKKYWEGKVKSLQDRKLEFEKDLEHALAELSKERDSRQEGLAVYTAERAALHTQKQSMLQLKSEVDAMSDLLTSDQAKFLTEKQNLHDIRADVCLKLDGLVEAKSILQAEKEALRMLRSWIEEEALRNRIRAEKLEQALRRWKCPDKFV